MVMRVLTDMIGAYFQSLVASHYKPHFLSLSVWQQTDIASSTFFPFWRFCVESKELCTPMRKKEGELLLISIEIEWISLYTHLEKDILIFLVCFRVYLFCKPDYRFELRFWILVLVESLDQRIAGAWNSKIRSIPWVQEQKKSFRPWREMLR